MAAAGGHHLDRALEDLGKLPAAPPAEVLSSVLGWLRELLSRNTEALRHTELAHTVEREDEPVARDARDAAAAGLSALVILARSRVEDVLGERGLARHGLAGEMPRAPEELEAHVTNAVALVEQSRVVAEEARGIPFASARVSFPKAGIRMGISAKLNHSVVSGAEDSAPRSRNERAGCAFLDRGDRAHG
ncbi:MAG: hypothetical protein HYV63_22820 [Candidatus Schekmanbacteria bacterium]|nr:hypothetical protein [Candidatus Schekmanbacteria bacterium]